MSSNGSTATPPVFNPTDLAKFGKEQADALIDMQQELAKLLEQANKDWLARVEQERELATELATKLSGAKTLPDAAKAYQDWMGRRMETIATDSQKFFTDCQKFAGSMNRLMMRGMPDPRH